MPELEFIKLLQTFGPSVAIIAFVLWKDFRREQRFMTRIEKLEDYQKRILQNLVEKTTTSLVQSSECLKAIGHMIEHLARVCPKMIGKNCDKLEGCD